MPDTGNRYLLSANWHALSRCRNQFLQRIFINLAAFQDQLEVFLRIRQSSAWTCGSTIAEIRAAATHIPRNQIPFFIFPPKLLLLVRLHLAGPQRIADIDSR